jgi:hypothetical protein
MLRRASLALLTLLAGCGHPPGPRPALSGLRAGPPDSQGVSSLRVRVRADFQEIGHLTAGKKVEHLLHAITFTAEDPKGNQVDRHLPIVVVGSVETVKLQGDYPDRVSVELLVFPKGFERKTLRFRAQSVFELEGGEPSFKDVSVPAESTPTPVRVNDVILAEDGDKRTIKVVLDRDVPASYQLWHCLEGRAHGLERRSPRVYMRTFDPPEVEDHAVVIDAGAGWMSPPIKPKTPRGEDDEEEEG